MPPLSVAASTGSDLVLQPGRSTLDARHQVLGRRHDQAAERARAPDARRPVTRDGCLQPLGASDLRRRLHAFTIGRSAVLAVPGWHGRSAQGTRPIGSRGAPDWLICLVGRRGSRSPILAIRCRTSDAGCVPRSVRYVPAGWTDWFAGVEPADDSRIHGATTRSRPSTLLPRSSISPRYLHPRIGPQVEVAGDHRRRPSRPALVSHAVSDDPGATPVVAVGRFTT